MKICFSFAVGTLLTGEGLVLRTCSPEMAQPLASRQALLLKLPEKMPPEDCTQQPHANGDNGDNKAHTGPAI